MRVWRLLIISLLLAGFAAAPVAAQLTRGFISGTVQDRSGAVMSGVKVVITNQATGIQMQTSTNEVGAYRFVAVEPGTYAIEFS